MSLEKITIVTGLNDRGSFDALQRAVDPSEFSEIGNRAYRELADFYEQNSGAKKAARDVIEVSLCTRYRKSEGAIRDYFNTLPEPAPKAAIWTLAVQLTRARLCDQILIALAKGDESRSERLMQEYVNANQSTIESSTYNGQEFASFFGRDVRGRLPVFPIAINQRLDGGIPRKSQIGVCARPNLGKSTFLANLSGCYAKNGFKVLYITNEDSAEETAIRVIARLSETPRNVVESSSEPHRLKALEVGLDRIFIESLNPGSLPEIRTLVATIRPDIFIVDQLYPIITSSKSGPTLELANFSSGTRRIAREFDCVSVIVTQRDKASGDRLYLKQEDAEWSSTGFAAQLDLMIGLANNEQMERLGRVMISFPRWKFGPRLPPLEAKFDFNICKVTA